LVGGGLGRFFSFKVAESHHERAKWTLQARFNTCTYHKEILRGSKEQAERFDTQSTG
jgi:hypothetical protein